MNKLIRTALLTLATATALTLALPADAQSGRVKARGATPNAAGGTTAGTAWRTGGSDRRYATIAFTSSSVMAAKSGHGIGGSTGAPSGRRPWRMAVMICSSVHEPRPVSSSGVRLRA